VGAGSACGEQQSPSEPLVYNTRLPRCYSSLHLSALAIGAYQLHAFTVTGRYGSCTCKSTAAVDGAVGPGRNEGHRHPARRGPQRSCHKVMMIMSAPCKNSTLSMINAHVEHIVVPIIKSCAIDEWRVTQEALDAPLQQPADGYHFITR